MDTCQKVTEDDSRRFPFDQKFLFEHPEISCGKWNCIFRNFLKKEDNFAKYIPTEVSENLSPRISVSFDIPPRISEILG